MVVPLVPSEPFTACAHTGNEMTRLNKYSETGSHQPWASLHAEQNERARNLRPGASHFLFGPRPAKAGLWALARGHLGAGAGTLLPGEGLPAIIFFEA